MRIDAPIAAFLRDVLEPARDRLLRLGEDMASGRDCLVTLQPCDFLPGTRIAHMRIGSPSIPARSDMMTVQAWFDDETRWQNGMLTLPTGRLPASVHAALVDRRVDEVAEGAVLGHLRIVSTQGAGASTRVRTNAGAEPFDPAALPVHPLGPDTHRVISFDGVRYVSQIADHVLRTMTPERARHALVWLTEAGPRDELDCGLCWSEIATGGLPAHLSDAPHFHEGTTGTGRTMLKIDQDRVTVRGSLVPQHWPDEMSIGEWRVVSARDHGPTVPSVDLIGFPLRRTPILTRMDGSGSAVGRDAEYIVSPDCPIQEIVEHTLAR
jgi:hypothetical protein